VILQNSSTNFIYQTCLPNSSNLPNLSTLQPNFSTKLNLPNSSTKLIYVPNLSYQTCLPNFSTKLVLSSKFVYSSTKLIYQTLLTNLIYQTCLPNSSAKCILPNSFSELVYQTHFFQTYLPISSTKPVYY